MTGAQNNSESENDNRSKQLNPNHPAYDKSRQGNHGKTANDNRANQLNPNHRPTKG